MRTIIGLTGSKGSGKTTAYNAIKESFDNVYEFTLAGHLKDVCKDVFELNEDQLHSQKYKESELDEIVILESEHLESIMEKFNVVDYSFDVHIRPHLGKCLYTPRQILQYIGTEVLHKIDPLIHAKYAKTSMPDKGLIVVTDLRFLNEFNFFEDNFSDELSLIYIKNNAAELVAENDKHPSEQDLHKFKHRCDQINNNETQSKFENSIIEYIKERL